MTIAILIPIILAFQVKVPKVYAIEGTKYSISGYLSADANSKSNEGIAVEVSGIDNSITDAKGYFKISNIPENTFCTIKISKKGYLHREIKNVPIKGNVQIGTESSKILIWAGDLQQDGSINMADVLLLALSFNSIKTDKSFVEHYDLNKDGIINMSDLIIMAAHFNKTPADYPEVEIKTVTIPETENPYPYWEREHSSYATFTGSGYTGGCANLDPIPSDMEITALNPTDYNSYGVKSALAGAYLEVTGPKGSTIVYVVDLYPEGADGACDLSPISFGKIGNMADGKIDIKWHIIKAPITGNFSYHIKEGSSPHWAAIQVRNHIYPVLKMEYYQDGNWINMEKTPWNHFIATNMGTTIPKIRITDIRGYTVLDTINSLPEEGTEGNFIIPGNTQFPD